jgi:hypothetical protein
MLIFPLWDFFFEVIEDILYTAGSVLIPVEVISLYVHICAGYFDLSCECCILICFTWQDIGALYRIFLNINVIDRASLRHIFFISICCSSFIFRSKLSSPTLFYDFHYLWQHRLQHKDRSFYFGNGIVILVGPTLCCRHCPLPRILRSCDWSLSPRCCSC